MSKKLTFNDLFAIGLGFTLGSAVFALTGVSAMYTGGSTFLAYLVGALAIFFSMLPVIVAGSVVPRQGVSYSLSKEAFGYSMGGFYFWIFFIGRIMILANVTSFGIFFTSVFTTLNPKIVAGTIVAIFYVANYFGINAAAKVQKILNIIMITSYGLFIVFGLGKMNTIFVFNAENFATGAASGFFSAVSLVMFSMGGGMAMLELGGISEDAEKNLPKICLLVTVLAGILYAGIALVTLGALPIVGMAEGGASIPGTLLFKGPANAVVNAAASIFSNSTSLLYMFIFGGACLAIATTVNGSFSWYSTPVQAACKDGWFPKWFDATNKYGSLYRIQAIYVAFVIATLFLFSSANISDINTNIIKPSTNLQILANIIPNFGMLSLPKLYPEIWKKSRWYMSNGKLFAFVWIPTIFAVCMWYLNFRSLTYTTQIIMGTLFAVGAIYALMGGKTFAKKVKCE